MINPTIEDLASFMQGTVCWPSKEPHAVGILVPWTSESLCARQSYGSPSCRSLTSLKGELNRL